MHTQSTPYEFSERDFAFLLDQVNRSGILGLTIDEDSIINEGGALRFKAAYSGETVLTTFIAPLDETSPDQVRIKSIISPTSTGCNGSWSEDGMSTGGHKVVLWALRPQPYMTLTKEDRVNIPADFKIEPWVTTAMTVRSRSISFELLDRVRVMGENRQSLSDALTSSLMEDSVLDRS
jgi:hypothetical protein